MLADWADVGFYNVYYRIQLMISVILDNFVYKIPGIYGHVYYTAPQPKVASLNWIVWPVV